MSQLSIHYFYYDYRNVIPIHSYEVIGQLASQNFDVTVFGALDRAFPYSQEWQERGIKIRPVPLVPIRVVMEMSFLFCLGVRLFLECLRPMPDVIYVRHGSLSPLVTLWGKLMNQHVYLEVNDIQTKRLTFSGIQLLKKIWIQIYEAVAFRLAFKVFPVTNGINEWVCCGFGRRSSDVVTVPNGVNIERFKPGEALGSRQKFAVPTDRKVVAYLGSLFPWSGIECLFESVPKVLASHRSVLFAIGGGEEPYRTRFTAEAESAGISGSIRFFGRIPWNEAAGFINMADICVAPANFSNTETGIASQKVLAYLACAKPVVGSNIQGLGDMLERESVGIPFVMGNSDSLAEAVGTLLSDPERAKHMGVLGRKLVEKEFSWQRIVEGLGNQFMADLTVGSK